VIGVDEVAQVLKDGEPEAFVQFRRTYFAPDLFPEIDARFPVTYTQVKADAEQLATRPAVAKSPYSGLPGKARVRRYQTPRFEPT
jgi:hypothetical protein